MTTTFTLQDDTNLDKSVAQAYVAGWINGGSSSFQVLQSDGTFGGGTDADAPLALALDAVEGGGWADADVLMVTDGELPPPSPATAARLDDAKATLGLRVHGLLVGREGVASPGVEAVCSDVHFFRSWGTVRAAEREGWA